MGLFVMDRSISLGVVRMYSLLNPFPIKRYVRHPFSSFLFKMPAVIEIEFLQGNNEQVLKEVGIRADGGGSLALSIPPALSYGTERLQREWIKLGRWVHSLQSSPNSTD